MSDDPRSESKPSHIRDRARELRRNATIPERLLWGLLPDRRLARVKFRRQHPVGPFVVDFYCAAHRLVVEFDGRSHQDRGHQDRERQNYLESVAGLRVFRVDNDDVVQDSESVILGVLKMLGMDMNRDRSPLHFKGPLTRPSCQRFLRGAV